MTEIVLQSAGSFAVAVLALVTGILQVALLARRPQTTWAGWSAGVSFSGMLYAIGIFFEYNTPAGPLNRYAGLLEFTAIIFLIHCAYGFTLAVLNWDARRYHTWAGSFHAAILVVLWTTDYIVADRFVSRDFLWLARPFIESDLGPLGPAFEFYGVASCIGVIVLCSRRNAPELRNRAIIITGIVFWLALAAHDGLASMGVPSVQYLMEYGFIGFSFLVLWVVFNGFEDMSTLERFRTVAEYSNDIIMMIQNGKVVFANPAAINLLGWFGRAPTIEDFMKIVEPEDRARFVQRYQGLLNGEAVPEFLLIRTRAPQGEVIIVEIRAKLVTYKSRPAILAFVRDTTQRIREEEGNFSAFFESMEDMIVVAKPDGMIIHANTATCQKLGYSPQELTTLHMTDLCLRRWRQEASDRFDAAARGGRHVWHFPLETKDRNIIPADVRIWPAMWNGADCLFGIAKDLTVEQDAKQMLNRMFRNNPALMALFSMPERRLLEANNAFMSMLGFDKTDIIGKTSAEIALFPDPDIDKTLMATVLAEGHVFGREVMIKRHDDTVFNCLFSGEIIRHKGRRLLLCVMIDISARKQAERQLLLIHDSLEQRVRERTRAIEEMHAQMVMQEKLASIGQVAAGMAHELNNPINFVSANFASLKEYFVDLGEVIRVYRGILDGLDHGPCRSRADAVRTPEKEEQIDFILDDMPVLFEESKRGFDRIDRVIRSMRQFSHTDQQGRFTPFDVNTAVENALVIARNTFKHCAQVELDLAKLPKIACLPEQIHQVLLNLIVNCAQAIEAQNRPEQGKIMVRTFQEPGYVVCQVADDGPGIPAHILPRIFEAFYTTKAPGKGSGLGLSLSHDIIVNKHRGQLEAKCPESGGTVFTMRIPDNLENNTAS